MTRSLLSRKEKIDHPTCSDARKPNGSHTSQSKLKDFLFHFFVQGFIEGARGGKGFFSVLYKNKFTHALYYILIASVTGVCRRPPVEAVGDGGLWQVL